MKRMMFLVLTTMTAVSSPPLVFAQQSETTQCQPTGSPTSLAGLPEASGLAASRRTPGRLWTHNDSGEPVVFSIDHRGTVTGQVRLSGATVEDWEAIAVGPCGAASCVYVGDIGDNEARRNRITVYAFPEPAAASGSEKVTEVFHATYPDGAHDAETMLVGGDGRLYIVTKGETGPVAIYRFPAKLQSGTTMMLERLGAASSGERNAESRITDGSVSPDGQWAVLRTRSALTFYQASDLLNGQWRAAQRAELLSVKEPQGEGVALGADGAVFLASEGGGKGQAGFFSRLSCALK